MTLGAEDSLAGERWWTGYGLFEPMLARAGFEILSVDDEDSVYGAYTCAGTAMTLRLRA